PADPRRSLYRAADIAALAQRKSRSRKVSEVAAGAIAWGEPVLASEITTVAGGRLFYRGRDAIRLADTETLESVARLLRGGHGADLIRRILVLVADHELNASAFAARVAASTGASLAASALAGLATLSGPRHGGATAAVRTFAAEAERLGPRQAIAERLVEDRALPGFGHLLDQDQD